MFVIEKYIGDIQCIVFFLGKLFNKSVFLFVVFWET